jgi:hypothetical protein
MSNYPHFDPGQKVRTKFGDIRTVRKQMGSQVFVEEPDINGWYDSGQLWPVLPDHTRKSRTGYPAKQDRLGSR